MNSFKPNIVVFRCNFCSPAGFQLDPSKLPANSNVKLIKTTCTGRIDPTFVFRAFSKGADGVMVVGCPDGDCHFISGNYKGRRNVMLIQDTLQQLGIEAGRVKLAWVKTSEAPKFAATLNEFVSTVHKLGPLSPN